MCNLLPCLQSPPATRQLQRGNGTSETRNLKKREIKSFVFLIVLICVCVYLLAELYMVASDVPPQVVGV